MKKTQIDESKIEKVISSSGITQAILSLKELKKQKNIRKREVVLNEKSSIIGPEDIKPKRKKKCQKKDESLRIRSKTLDSHGQFTRARLLSGIVDKIKEVREIPSITTENNTRMSKIKTKRQIQSPQKSTQSRKKKNKKKQIEAQIIRELTREVRDLKRQLRKQKQLRQSGFSSLTSIHSKNQPAFSKSQQRIFISSPSSECGKDLTESRPNETHENLRKSEITVPVRSSSTLKIQKSVERKQIKSCKPHEILPPEYKRIQQPYRIQKSIQKSRSPYEYQRVPRYPPTAGSGNRLPSTIKKQMRVIAPQIQVETKSSPKPPIYRPVYKKEKNSLKPPQPSKPVSITYLTSNHPHSTKSTKSTTKVNYQKYSTRQYRN